MTRSKNYEGFCHKKGFLQGSINYHMNAVLARQRKGRHVTCETKSTYHRVIYLVKCFKNVQCPFTTNLPFFVFTKTRHLSYFFSYKDKLSRSQNSEVTSLSCQLLDSLTYVFIKLRKDYNIGKLTSLKTLSKECNQSLTVDHMTDQGHNMKRDYYKILANQNQSNTVL